MKESHKTKELQLENTEVNNFLSTLSIILNQQYLLVQILYSLTEIRTHTETLEMVTAIPEKRYRFIISLRPKKNVVFPQALKDSLNYKEVITTKISIHVFFQVQTSSTSIKNSGKAQHRLQTPDN